MANEIQLAYGVTGQTLYAIVRNSTGQLWNGAAFEAFNAANWTSYDIAMTEQGSSGYYVGDLPAVSAAKYQVDIRNQQTGTPLITDPVAGSGEIDTTVIADSIWNEDFGGGRTAAYFQMGGCNKVVRDEDGFTVYNTDDTTPIMTAVSTGDETLPTLATIDP